MKTETQIEVRVLDVQPHPDQATNNPRDWAVQFCVKHDGMERTFWRWHTVYHLDDNGVVIRPDPVPPTHDEILAHFWRQTFLGMGGFAFDKDDP